MAVSVTVIAHLLIAGIAAIVAVSPYLRQEPEVTASLLAPETSKPKRVQREVLQQQIQETVSQAPPMPEVVRAPTAATFAVPDMRDILPQTPLGLGAGDLGSGFGAGQNRRMGSGAAFFGQKVSGRLGVVFDVSGSMVEYVPIVIKEIEAKFSDAMIVCADYAPIQMLMGEPEASEYSEHVKNNPRLTLTPDGRVMNEALMQMADCWFLTRDYNSLGGGIEYLLKWGVDSVFVFSDFQDPIDPTYLKSLETKATGEKANITFHVLDKAPRYRRELEQLCNRTGGRFYEGELLKRRSR
ncbi:MAG: hypothetical protein AAF191_17315 [Verrucomicrobiota bacterium]